MLSLTKQEITEFINLSDIKVVFDIGARDSVDYIILEPNATHHIFEPNIDYFNLLREKIEKLPQFKGEVHLNNFGLGDSERLSPYNARLECFIDGPARPGWGGDVNLPIKTLDWYIGKNNINRIDFIKIDAEGYDLQILKGGAKAISMARFIQFETWDNLEEFKLLLGNVFEFKDIGSRNIFCTQK